MHCVAVRPTMGAIVRHCVWKIFAACTRRSSSARVHSVFLMLGSRKLYHRALHWRPVLRVKRLAIRSHWFGPYL
jgi:hypothetical protein